MKKTKILLAIPALATVISPVMVLTNCSESVNENDPTIDPSFSDKVTQTIVRNEDGSVTCKLVTTHVEQKITDVSVKIGDTTLVEAIDYSIASANGGNMSINIFKVTLKKYKGDIVITPTLDSKTFSGIIVELTQSSFYKGDTFTKDNVNVFESWEGDKGSLIDWSTNKLKMYDQDDNDITDIGFTFSDWTTYTFTIKYDGTYTKQISITVARKTYTINCSVEGEFYTLSKTTITAQEENTWQDVKDQITIKANEDVDTSTLTPKWFHTDGSEIDDEEVIDENFGNVKLTYTRPAYDPQKTPTYSCQLRQEGGAWKCNCYVYGGTEGTTVTPIGSSLDTLYTFTCDLTNVTGYFRYFWIGTKLADNTTRLLKIYKENIESITIDNKTVGFSIYNYDDSCWVIFDETFTKGDGTLTIKYRPIAADGSKLYPGFEADSR